MNVEQIFFSYCYSSPQYMNESNFNFLLSGFLSITMQSFVWESKHFHTQWVTSQIYFFFALSNIKSIFYKFKSKSLYMKFQTLPDNQISNANYVHQRNLLNHHQTRIGRKLKKQIINDWTRKTKAIQAMQKQKL